MNKRCDRCGSRASFGWASTATALVLYTCGHHAREHQSELKSQSFKAHVGDVKELVFH